MCVAIAVDGNCGKLGILPQLTYWVGVAAVILAFVGVVLTCKGDVTADSKTTTNG